MEVKGCRKLRLCSRWTPPSGTLGFMVPLVAVLVVVVLVGLKTPNWLIASNWNWGASAIPGGEMNRSATSSPPAAEGGAFSSEMKQSVTGGGRHEVHLDSLNFHGAASPPPEKIGDSPNSTNPSNTSSSSLFKLSSEINKRSNRLDITEAQLQKARAAIQAAKNTTDGAHAPYYIPTGPVYLNPSAFHRSYLEMEKNFKVYVYEEGEHPIFHNGPCGSIYSIEGYFIYQLEISNFRTRDPKKAHVFFLPFSVASIVHYIFDSTVRKHRWRPLRKTVKDYVDLVARKYPFWNMSLGYDHFMLSCHDWGPELSKSIPWLSKNSIRALCNANTTEGFEPFKDASIPEINLPGGNIKRLLGGPSPSTRSILAFFAGGLHGPIRPILLEHWEKKDLDIQVQRYLPKDVSYYTMLRKSKYCICPSGYEVASPRIVEALYTGCVPVIIKDHYVLPFSDVLNWKSFAVEIPVAEIPNLKKILTGISTRQYIRMQRRGVIARRHFEVNLPPRSYDVFHMILHSVWLRRLNFRLPDVKDF
ncbi:probable glycosyltransferase At5g03795 [Andrographis paniculata]|uniref:probable glycosyltransferase At5g03795 n=1 Tax=Andrographis paniculata TaxID=175694 RepID=UPI0021E7EC88|nr:probable glycosyltransferase At5g03795 [Andrographis paniculata]